MAKSGLKRLYHIPILSKALDILELLQAEDEPLSLEALYQRTRISKTSVYRILKTFAHRGYVAQTENGLYRLATRPRKIRFGFGGQSEDGCSFVRRGFDDPRQPLRRRHGDP